MDQDMKQDTSKFGPHETKGRPFLKDGVWIFVFSDGGKYYMKVTEDDFKKAASGEMFAAYHALAMQPGSPPVFLPSIVGTIEPWYCSGEKCSWVSLVHPELSKNLDDQIERGLSIIATAKAGDVPPIKGKLHLA